MNTKDIMIKLSDCAQVSKEQSLQAAVIMLAAVRRRCQDMEFRPRFVLVHNEHYQVVGVIRDIDIVRALAKTAGTEAMTLPHLIGLTSRIPAGEAMVPYGAEQCVDVDDSLEKAIEKMVSGTLRHLLVKDGDTTVGIVRLTEIFALISRKSGIAVRE